MWFSNPPKINPRQPAWKPAGSRTAIAPLALKAVECLMAKDVAGWTTLLAKHPSLIAVRFVKVPSNVLHPEEALLGHLVANANWVEGLDALAAAGDRFDRPANPQAPVLLVSSHVSAMGRAIGRRLPNCVRRMLELGADPNACAHARHPLSQFPKKPWSPRKHAPLARVLLSHGADVFTVELPQVTFRSRRPRAVFWELLGLGQTGLLLTLLEKADPLPAHVCNDPDLWSIYSYGLSEFRDQAAWERSRWANNCPIKLLHRLVALGAPPPGLDPVLSSQRLLSSNGPHGCVFGPLAQAVVSYQENPAVAAQWVLLQAQDYPPQIQHAIREHLSPILHAALQASTVLATHAPKRARI